MRLIDTNGVEYALNRNVVPTNEYFVAPEIVEELEMGGHFLGKNLHANYIRLDTIDGWNPQAYLRHYRDVLNKLGGRSFYNMTGFGDVSIVAALLTLKEIAARKPQQDLFAADEKLLVYTGDEGLMRRIGSEFGNDVELVGLDSVE